MVFLLEATIVWDQCLKLQEVGIPARSIKEARLHCTPTENLDLEHAREQAIEKILNEKTGNSESRK